MDMTDCEMIGDLHQADPKRDFGPTNKATPQKRYKKALFLRSAACSPRAATRYARPTHLVGEEQGRRRLEALQATPGGAPCAVHSTDLVALILRLKRMEKNLAVQSTSFQWMTLFEPSTNRSLDDPWPFSF